MPMRSALGLLALVAAPVLLSAQVKLARPPADYLQKFVPPPPPPGPPPTFVNVHGAGPAIQVVSWTKPQLNGVSFRVLRQILPNTEWKVLTPTLTTYPYFNDTTVLTPNTTTYRVVAVYDDGRQGVAEYAFPNPVPMESPKNLWNQQVGEGRVYLKWEPVNNSYGYKIFGPGLPATGKLVTGISDTVSGAPLGNQTYRVATWYLSDGSMATAPSTAVNVVRWTAHYRVMLNGIVVSHSTTDGPNDGRGDEIYAAAHVMRYTRTSGNSAPAWSDEYVAKTSVYGDRVYWPNRIQAGSASPTGGITSGDVVPPNPAYPVAAPVPSQFPLLVWDGTITANKELIVIAPSLWDWDGDTTQFHQWWSGQSGVARFGTKLDLSAIQSSQQSTRFEYVQLFKNIYGAPIGHSGDGGNGYDRAIGLEGGAFNYSLPDRGIILTQEKLERAFAAFNVSRVVMPMQFTERMTNDTGDYLLYFQVERLP